MVWFECLLVMDVWLLNASTVYRLHFGRNDSLESVGEIREKHGGTVCARRFLKVALDACKGSKDWESNLDVLNTSMVSCGSNVTDSVSLIGHESYHSRIEILRTVNSQYNILYKLSRVTFVLYILQFNQ